MQSKRSYQKKAKEMLNRFSRDLELDFEDQELLLQALTHSSFSNESHRKIESNERLEYLGDSVLGLIVNEYLFFHYNVYHEGDLAKIKSLVVSELSLSELAREIGLGDFLFLSKGEEQSGGRSRDSILADAVEALLAAIYIDKGLEKAKSFILKYLIPKIEKADNTRYKKDYKSFLQEIIQKKYATIPIYEIVDETGPDHLKSFTAKVFINEKEYGKGVGQTKKKAEQNAAQKALERDDL